MTWGKEKAPRARGTFEQEWPELALGLDKALRARHVPSVRREDIIQETGLRLFVRWPELDPERPLWPFAVTIATNLMKDEQRMHARRSAAQQPHSELVGQGVEEEALARLELNNVRVALEKLTPAQRSVLLADIGAAPYDDRAPAALKMLRMRARRTLRNVINRASALVSLTADRWRRATNSARVISHRTTAAEPAQAIALSSIGVAGAASILTAALGIVPWPAPSTPPVDATASVVAAVPAGRGAARPHALEDVEGAHARSSAPAALARHARGHVLRGGGQTDETTAAIGAGGTGIDEDPSLDSETYHVAISARATVAGHNAVVDYRLETANPACGSPSDPRDRPCLRPGKPRSRARFDVGGWGSDDLESLP
jgi:RNA polymerase sigma factor (sigma-70 family)